MNSFQERVKAADKSFIEVKNFNIGEDDDEEVDAGSKMQLDEVRFSDSSVIIFLDSVKILVFSFDFTGLHFIYLIGEG